MDREGFQNCLWNFSVATISSDLEGAELEDAANDATNTRKTWKALLSKGTYAEELWA